jgi:hypothetical protein
MSPYSLSRAKGIRRLIYTHYIVVLVPQITSYCIFLLTFPQLWRDKKTILNKGEPRTMRAKIATLIILALLLPALSGCWYVAAAGAGAAVGYYASKEGYGVQSPVTYKTPQAHQDKEGQQ